MKGEWAAVRSQKYLLSACLLRRPGQRSQSTSFETAQSGPRNMSPSAMARIEQNKAEALAKQQAKRQKNASGEAAQR